jgi:hypothetical protein
VVARFVLGTEMEYEVGFTITIGIFDVPLAVLLCGFARAKLNTQRIDRSGIKGIRCQDGYRDYPSAPGINAVGELPRLDVDRDELGGRGVESVFENSCNAHFGTIQGPCTGRFNHPNPLHISPAHLRIGRFADSHKYFQNTLLQDLGFLAFTLPDVAILMPTKKPRGEELT